MISEITRRIRSPRDESEDSLIARIGVDDTDELLGGPPGQTGARQGFGAGRAGH